MLGDDPRAPRFIETVSSIGYRFICPVEVAEEPAGDLPNTRGAEVSHPDGSESDTVPAALLPQVSVDAAREPPDAGAEAPISRAKWAAFTGAVFLCLGLVIWLFISHPSHALTDKDSIVLTDFVNTTGDAVFDGTLRQGLAVQLGQSPFLNLVSDQQIQHTLSLMGQPPDARLDSGPARQLCQRIAAAAVVEGSITRLGTEHVLGLKAVSCRTGDVLGEQQVQAARKEEVLKALSRTRAELRKNLGESLITVEKFDTPLDEATTPRAAFALALAGGPAERLAEDLAHKYPEDTLVHFVFLPVIRAQLAHNHRDPARAVKELEAASAFEVSNGSVEQEYPFALYPCYLRGMAFLASNQGKKAAAEFKKILDHPGIVINEPIGALAHKNLARAYALMGQLEKQKSLNSDWETLHVDV